MAARLTAHGLVIRYPTGFTVGPVDLDLGPGVHHLVGANGTGKTTLLRALCGGLRPAEGRVSVCGRDPHADHGARALVSLATSAGEVPGFLTVDEGWRILAALRRSPDWDGDVVRRALDLPAALRLEHASAGQRRRAELLCALVGDPPVLLLDETFAHLDTTGVDWLAAELDRRRGDRVVLLAHHGRPPVAVDHAVPLTASRGGENTDERR